MESENPDLTNQSKLKIDNLEALYYFEAESPRNKSFKCDPETSKSEDVLIIKKVKENGLNARNNENLSEDLCDFQD